MTPVPDETRPRARRWARAASVVLVPLALAACSPAEEAPADDAEAAETRAAEGADAAETAATAAAAPCRWTASGEELTGRASPPDSSSVALDGETARICYSAPSMRDRQIMGELVPYGQPWRIGANEPTTLHLPVAAEVGGVRVEPGSYSLFAIPGESEWTIVVNSATDRWGVPIDAGVRESDVGSFTVQPESTEQPVERMSIELESAEGGSARAILEWETTRVSFPIRPVEG